MLASKAAIASGVYAVVLVNVLDVSSRAFLARPAILKESSMQAAFLLANVRSRQFRNSPSPCS